MPKAPGLRPVRLRVRTGNLMVLLLMVVQALLALLVGRLALFDGMSDPRGMHKQHPLTRRRLLPRLRRRNPLAQPPADCPGVNPSLPPSAIVQVGLVLYGFHPLQRWRYRHIPGQFVTGQLDCRHCPPSGSALPPPSPPDAHTEAAAGTSHPRHPCCFGCLLPCLLPCLPLDAGPRPTWLVGNILEILRAGQETACARWGRQYGPVWCFWMGGIPVVSLCLNVL